jgi:uncharacterized protein (TIGR02271 family)
MFTDDQIRVLRGADVFDHTGTKVGTVGQVWADTSGQPSWVGVITGLFGYSESLMPLLGASFSDGALRTPYAKALVVDAPNVDINSEQPLDSAGLQDLYRHYALTLDESATDGPGDPGDDAMTRSEERLTVGMEQHPTGKVRMRKHIVTEYVTTTVPVRREELRLEHVPPDEAGTGQTGSEAQDAEAAESEHEMILYAERPVVTTETVPVERVRLGKQTVTEQQTVSGEVRKERIELDLPDDPHGATG